MKLHCICRECGALGRVENASVLWSGSSIKKYGMKIAKCFITITLAQGIALDQTKMPGIRRLRLDTETMLAAGVTPPKKTPRFTAKDLTDEEAALHLQGAWRAKQARSKLRAIVRRQYKKVFDPNTKKFYYFNYRTKVAHWTKPLCLGSEDLELTARQYIAAGITRQKKRHDSERRI